jgi:hypothetical protein
LTRRGTDVAARVIAVAPRVAKIDSDFGDETAMPEEREEKPKGPTPEDRPGEVGAEGGSETARRSKLPAMPDAEDDSAVGDTDQHSTG